MDQNVVDAVRLQSFLVALIFGLESYFSDTSIFLSLMT